MAYRVDNLFPGTQFYNHQRQQYRTTYRTINGHHRTKNRALLQVENWTTTDVLDWLGGVVDNSPGCLKQLKKAKIDGKRLFDLDSDSLQMIGIDREYTRAEILRAIKLLSYYNFDLQYTNLQKLAMDTSLAASSLVQSVLYATQVITSLQSSYRYIDVLNRVLRSIANLYDRVLTLNFWLDRRPYDDVPECIEKRRLLAFYCGELIDCINDPSKPRFFSLPHLLSDKADIIYKVSQQIVHSNDPSILYTSNLDQIFLRKTTPENGWGFDIGIACTGVNVVTDFFYDTNEYEVVASRVAGKLDIGDEIIEIGGTPVIGWKYSSLVNKLNETLFNRVIATTDNCTVTVNKSHKHNSVEPKLSGNNKFEVVLLVCRRPCDMLSSILRPPKIFLSDVSFYKTKNIQVFESSGYSSDRDNFNIDLRPNQQNSSPQFLATDFKKKIFQFHCGSYQNKRGPPIILDDACLKEQSFFKNFSNRNSSATDMLRRVRSFSLTSSAHLSTKSPYSLLQTGERPLRMRKSCLFVGRLPASYGSNRSNSNSHQCSSNVPFFAEHQLNGSSDSYMSTSMGRRASIWSKSPRLSTILRSPFDGYCSESNAWILLTSWGVKTAIPTTLSTQNGCVLPQPSPVTPDFTTATTGSGETEGSRVSVILLEDEELTEDDGFSKVGPANGFEYTGISSSDETGTSSGWQKIEQKRKRSVLLDPNKIIYSSIDTISEADMHLQQQQINIGNLTSGSPIITMFSNHHHLLAVSANDPEWWLNPVTDITGLKLTKRTHLESGSSISIIDSPLSTIHQKIARFFGGNSENPSPTSLPHSVTTPILNEQLRTPLRTNTPMTPGARFSHDFFSLFTSVASTASQSPSIFPLSASTPILALESAPSSMGKNNDNSNSSLLLLPVSPYASVSPSGWSVDSSGSGWSRVKTITTEVHKRRPERLAPLAEPDCDELAETSAFTFPDTTERVPLGKTQSELTPYQISMVKNTLEELAKAPCSTFNNRRRKTTNKLQQTILEGWLNQSHILRNTDGKTTVLINEPGCVLENDMNGACVSHKPSFELKKSMSFLRQIRRCQYKGNWNRCWTLVDMQSGLLYSYKNGPSAVQADIVLNLACFTLYKSATSDRGCVIKRYPFVLRRFDKNREEDLFHFYVSNSDEFDRWCDALSRFAKKPVLPFSISEGILQPSENDNFSTLVTSSGRQSEKPRFTCYSSNCLSEGNRNLALFIFDNESVHPSSSPSVSTPNSTSRSSLLTQICKRISTRRRRKDQSADKLLKH